MEMTTRFNPRDSACPTNCSAKSPSLAGPAHRWIAKMVLAGNRPRAISNSPPPCKDSKITAARESARDIKEDVLRNQDRPEEMAGKQGTGSTGRKAADQECEPLDLMPYHELGSSEGV